jgi:3-deoxy-D-manno-octulosonic-acid transferase
VKWGEWYLSFIQWPCLTLLKNLLFFIPVIRERFKFEQRNLTDPGAQSFKLVGSKAHICFEFSSEGEYQQVAALIDDALKLGERVELVFFSPSVEKTITELQQKYPEQIRYLRYPVRGREFLEWVSSKHLVLVRYDLFPEFLIWARRPGHRLSFLWISFKKERLKGRSISWMKEKFLLSSQLRVYASQEDLEWAEKFSLPGVAYDFRMEQIQRRLQRREAKLDSHFSSYKKLTSLWQNYPPSQRLIMGNCWPEDIELLEHLGEDFFILIIPHQLGAKNLSEIQRQLKLIGKQAPIISELSGPQEMSEARNSSVLILNKKGVLCELYADFKLAYVGGGLLRSVHSMLEPLIAGCEKISCGPRHERSSEYDLAVQFAGAREVKDAQEFIAWAKHHGPVTLERDKLKNQLACYDQFSKDVLLC